MKNRTLLKSFNEAVDGIIYVLRTQRNIRIHFVVAFVVLGLSLFLSLSRLEFIVLLFSIALVIVAELLNTSVELTIDLVTKSFEPLAKIAKDVAAGAVLLAAINAVLVGYFLFFKKLSPYTFTVLQKVRQAPPYLTLVCLLLVVLIVIVVKALAGQTNFFRGGFVSGHAAVAFCLATAIAFLAKNATITTLAFFIALVVSHSRIENRTHSILEVSAGGAIGVLVTVAVFQLMKI